METLGKFYFFFQAEDGIRDIGVTGVQTCALPIYSAARGTRRLHDGDPHVHLRLERVPVRHHVPAHAGDPAGDGRDPELRQPVHDGLRGAGRRRGGRHGAAGHYGPYLPAADRLRPHGRRGEGLTWRPGTSMRSSGPGTSRPGRGCARASWRWTRLFARTAAAPPTSL